LTPKIQSKFFKKEKNKTNLFNSKKNNLLFNSIDVKYDYPKYVLLHKIFKNNVKKKEKDLFPLFGGKIDKEQLKKYKIKNDKDYKNYIIKRVKLHYNNNFNS
jgi:hypothetical protein